MEIRYEPMYERVRVENEPKGFVPNMTYDRVTRPEELPPADEPVLVPLRENREDGSVGG